MAERCRAAGAASCAALHCDVADSASIQSLAGEVEKRCPEGLDALMIVAGVVAKRDKQDLLSGQASDSRVTARSAPAGVPRSMLRQPQFLHFSIKRRSVVERL